MQTTPDQSVHRPPPPEAEKDQVSPDGSSEGTLDLDEHDSINNQHLEVR